MIVFLVLVIGLALAVLATGNLQLSNSELNRNLALEVARAGISQYLYDSDNAPPPSPRFVLSTARVLSSISLRGATPLSDQRTPYPIPGSRLPGSCYLTFNKSKPYWSVDNLKSSEPADGWRGPDTVPPFCIDLIATGVVNGVEKHVECVISRRWDYALSTPCYIDVGGTETGSDTAVLPSIVTGDVFTARTYNGNDPVINVGRRLDPDAVPPSWVSSSNNGIKGYLRVASKSTSSIYVDTSRSNAVSGTKFGTTESRYPPVALPDASSWTDLAATFTYDNRAANQGAYLASYVSSSGASCYAIMSDGTHSTTAFTIPAGNWKVNGNLVGAMADGSASTATELVLNDAQLQVNGDVAFSDHPKRLFGNQSLLWATGDVTFKDGFIDGGDNGMVLYARSLVTRAGGNLNGLVLAENEVAMEPYDKTLTSSTDITLFNTLRTKSLSSAFTGSYIQIGQRRIAGMYIRGGVFTPDGASVGPDSRFTFRSVNLTWDPAYLKVLHDYADRKVCYWQEIP
ncbi:MAG: hypothetical protein EB084_17210 [Proteobacteria bacterium]|nr:hypothetical protein [Pseudomonadota bacterium]